MKAGRFKQGCYIIRFGNTCIGISLLLPIFLAASFLLGVTSLFILVMLSVSLHETGHMAAALSVGKRVSEIRVLPYGLSVSVREQTHLPAHSMVIYLSGPAASILLFLLLRHISALTGSSLMHTASHINFSIAVFNMLPVLPLDGGKLLREILAAKLGYNLSSRMLKRITAILLVVTAAGSLVMMLAGYVYISLWGACIFIFVSCEKEKTEGPLMNIKNILNRHSRIKNKGVYPIRHLAVFTSTRLGEVIKHMDFNRLHIIYTIDSKNAVKGRHTEFEIIEAAVRYGSSTKMGELTSMN